MGTASIFVLRNIPQAPKTQLMARPLPQGQESRTGTQELSVGTPPGCCRARHSSLGTYPDQRPPTLETLHGGLLHSFSMSFLAASFTSREELEDLTSRLLNLSIRNQPSIPQAGIAHLKESGHGPHQLFEKLCLVLVEHCGGGSGEEGRAGQAVGQGSCPSPPGSAYSFPYQTGMETPDRW